MSKLSDEDKNSIAYFWIERGSLERWCDWEEKLPIIEQEYPELVFAWRQIKVMKRIISSVVESF